MGPASADTITRVNHSSIIMDRYRDAVNPDSAEEKLERRAAEAQAAREKEMERLRRQVEKQQEKEEAARQRAAERRARQVENVLGSVLRTAGREITRSIFGTRKR